MVRCRYTDDLVDGRERQPLLSLSEIRAAVLVPEKRIYCLLVGFERKIPVDCYRYFAGLQALVALFVLPCCVSPSRSSVKQLLV